MRTRNHFFNNDIQSSKYTLIISIFIFSFTIPSFSSEINNSNPKNSDSKIIQSNNNEDLANQFQKILDHEPDEKDYRTTVRCIDSRRIDDHKVLSNRFIIVKMENGEQFLIQFKTACAGLRPNELVRFDRYGSRFCKGDLVRGYVADLQGTMTWSQPCRVPGFEPVTDVQIAQLKRALYGPRVE